MRSGFATVTLLSGLIAINVSRAQQVEPPKSAADIAGTIPGTE